MCAETRSAALNTKCVETDMIENLNFYSFQKINYTVFCDYYFFSVLHFQLNSNN